MAGKPSNLSDITSEPLTQREHEILDCIVDGLSNQEIANKLFLAEKTVRWYNTQIYRKLGVANRQEAIDRMQAAVLLNVARASSAGLVLSRPPVVTGKFRPPAARPWIASLRNLCHRPGTVNQENSSNFRIRSSQTVPRGGRVCPP